MKRFIKLLIGFLFFVSCSNSKIVNDTEIQKGFQCLLSEPKFAGVHCGVLSVWVGMKFKKMRDRSSFVGMIQCPELFDSSFFSKGRVYDVKIDTTQLPGNKHLLVNFFEKEGLPTYQIKSIEIVSN